MPEAAAPAAQEGGGMSSVRRFTARLKNDTDNGIDSKVGGAERGHLHRHPVCHEAVHTAASNHCSR